VVDLDSAVEEHEFQIAVADREHQIPSHGPKDRLGCELPPLEAITQTHTDTRPIVPPQSYGKSASSKVRNKAILFVEDETLVRMDMAEFLRECGYRVYEAATAKEAIKALQAKFAVDLVFTDINLRDDMNGLELGEWTLRERPGVKVLVTTGDASRTVDIPQTVGLVLAKPYTGRDLLDRVRQALTKPSGDGGAGPQTG
jgi:CheY-like chemotaxis protein